MRIGDHEIGVCSWSLEPKDMNDLVRLVQRLEIQHLQLGVGALIALDDVARARELAVLSQSGLVVTSGMIGFPGEDYSSIASIKLSGGYVPDTEWEARKDLTARAAALCRELGLTRLTTHVGYVPPSSDDRYRVMLDRICAVAEILARYGQDLLMETGQEPASELLQFLNDLRCRNVFVNFDPANMILYGAGDPIEAVQVLGRHIRHVHVKDAIASEQPSVTWGKEVPFGTGEVPVDAFLEALKTAGYRGPLVIEREAGHERFEDIQFAIETIRRSLEGP